MSKKKKKDHDSANTTPQKIPPLNQPFAALKDIRAKMDAAEAKDGKAAAKSVPVKETPAVTRSNESDDDALSFHRLMSGVVPLASSKIRIPKTATTAGTDEGLRAKAKRAEADAVLEAEEEDVRARLRALVGEARFEVSDDGTRVEGRRVDVTPDLLRRLRRGQFPIDARVDLHGLKAEEARARVATFLREKRTSGERCVLIVHGRGEHSARGIGVLRGEISAWLSQGSAAHHVAAFATAGQSDGGEGAVYVLLRR